MVSDDPAGIYQGEIWWVELPTPSGSEPGFNRPALVVQSDAFNASALQTVIVVILTSNMRRAGAPGNVVFSKAASGLPKESVANVSQIVALDKAMFSERVNMVPAQKLKQVQDGIRLVLGLASA